MSKEDLISVIMSTYNEDLKWIEESVDSILNQTYRNLEFVIILDNPNNKQLKDMLEDYRDSDNRIKLIINEKNIGLVKSLNIALQHCTGKYIARMDADDISVENRLEQQKTHLEGNGLDFIFSGVQVIDEYSLESYESNNNELKPDKVKRLLEITNCTYHPTWFIKSEVYKELGGYREVSYCEDYDFSLRSISKGYKIGKMNENILKYRIRSNSISRSFSLEQYLNMRGILRLYKRSELDNEVEVERILKISKEKASKEESEKFRLADIEMNQAVGLIKQKEFVSGLIRFLKSIKISKYYRKKNIDYLFYTLYRKL